MSAALYQIEQAIRANFILAKEGTRYLESDYYAEGKSLSTARIVFVGIALENDYSAGQICEYLNMTLKEFSGKKERWRRHYKAGIRKEHTRERKFHYKDCEVEDNDLRIYRKAQLVRNYLTLINTTRVTSY